MKTSDNKPFVYEKQQLIETLCQLRFPTILSIDAKAPADFQDTIRAVFPRYACHTDNAKGPDGKTQPVRNHSFITEDGAFKISLTKDFIALSTMRYPGWERFARMLDEPLGQFIRIYHPAYFSRIGLRYINGVSREKLGLTDRRWNELFRPHLLGVLADGAVNERDVVKCAMDVEQRLGDRIGVKTHAGPGMVSRRTRNETVQEPCFILDFDVYSIGNTPLGAAAETMEQLHAQADRLFSGAITDTLHNALEPVLL